MTLDRPPDWPISLPPPLIPAQAEEVRQWYAATHQEVAVVVLCKKCRTPVGDTRDLTLEDDDGQGWYLPARSIYIGTIRTSDRRLEVAKSGRVTRGAVTLPEQRPGAYVPMDDQYLACLEPPSAQGLPAWLPAWCDRDLHLGVERRSVTLALAKWRRRGLEQPVRVDALPRPPRPGRYA